MKVTSPRHQADLDNEIYVFQRMPRHPNIVTYINSYDEHDVSWLSSSFVAGSSA
jgi:hypothetical protein